MKINKNFHRIRNGVVFFCIIQRQRDSHMAKAKLERLYICLKCSKQVTGIQVIKKCSSFIFINNCYSTIIISHALNERARHTEQRIERLQNTRHNQIALVIYSQKCQIQTLFIFYSHFHSVPSNFTQLIVHTFFFFVQTQTWTPI